MVRTTFFLLLLATSSAYAENCNAVIEGFESKDIIYVLCKDLSDADDKKANEIVTKVMGQYNGPPDEIIVYFISSMRDIGKIKPDSENLVAFYYTHSNELTIWPGQKGKKRVFKIQWN